MSVKYFNAEYKNISESQYQDEKFKLQVELLKLQEWVVNKIKESPLYLKEEMRQEKDRPLNVHRASHT